MVTPSLDINRGEVHTEREPPRLEQVVRELVTDEFVTTLGRLVAET